MQKIAKEVGMPPHVKRLVTTILDANPLYASGLHKTLVSLEQDEMQYLEDYLVFCLGQNLSIDYLSECYLTITADVLREAIYFQENQTYIPNQIQITGFKD